MHDVQEKQGIAGAVQPFAAVDLAAQALVRGEGQDDARLARDGKGRRGPGGQCTGNNHGRTRWRQERDLGMRQVRPGRGRGLYATAHR
jgi:hypothetical protein